MPKNYFCPDCGWEGGEPICAVCGSATELFDVGEGENDNPEDLPLDELDKITVEGEQDQAI